jgi:hypothetical protein
MAKKHKATDTTDGNAELAYEMAVGGSLKGSIRDVEVGLVTGEIVQVNGVASTSANLAVGTADSVTQHTASNVLQVNNLSLSGDASLDFDIRQDFRGQIRDIEVSLVTGDIIQINFADQHALNAALGTSGETTQSIWQGALQANVIEIAGSVALDIVTLCDFHGQMRNIEVGLITGDIVQSNDLLQWASNLAFETVGGTAQTISQLALQENIVQVIGGVRVSIVFEGDFKGQFRDVTVGILAADVLQANESLAVGVNLAALNDGKTTQDIAAVSSQMFWVDVEGALNVEIRIADGVKGSVRGLQIDVVVDNVLHESTDSVWG